MSEAKHDIFTGHKLEVFEVRLSVIRGSSVQMFVIKEKMDLFLCFYFHIEKI